MWLVVTGAILVYLAIGVGLVRLGRRYLKPDAPFWDDFDAPFAAMLVCLWPFAVAGGLFFAALNALARLAGAPLDD